MKQAFKIVDTVPYIHSLLRPNDVDASMIPSCVHFAITYKTNNI